MAVQLNLFGEEVKPKGIAKRKVAMIAEQPPKIPHVKKKLIRKYKTLDVYYSRLYEGLGISLLEQREIIKSGWLIAYVDEKQAEIKGTERMSVNKRIKFYTEILGYLKKKGAFY